jgi:uncharacterized membrane protein YdbT with pleckstrin-like domain
MPYIEQNLMPEEQILYRAQLHWAMFIPPALAVLVGFVFFVVVIASRNRFTILILLAFFVLLSGILSGISAIVSYYSTEFALTTKRVIAKTGVVQRRSIELLLPKVESISVTQPILGRLLDYGTITVTGTGGTKELFRNIAAPLELRKRVNAQLAAS